MSNNTARQEIADRLGIDHKALPSMIGTLRWKVLSLAVDVYPLNSCKHEERAMATLSWIRRLFCASIQPNRLLLQFERYPRLVWDAAGWHSSLWPPLEQRIPVLSSSRLIYQTDKLTHFRIWTIHTIVPIHLLLEGAVLRSGVWRLNFHTLGVQFCFWVNTSFDCQFVT